MRELHDYKGSKVFKVRELFDQACVFVFINFLFFIFTFGCFGSSLLHAGFL